MKILLITSENQKKFEIDNSNSRYIINKVQVKMSHNNSQYVLICKKKFDIENNRLCLSVVEKKIVNHLSPSGEIIYYNYPIHLLNGIYNLLK